MESQIGRKRVRRGKIVMSAFPPKADIALHRSEVRFGHYLPRDPTRGAAACSGL